MKANLKKTFGVFVAAVLAYGAYAALAPGTALACSCRTWCPPPWICAPGDCVCSGSCLCCECQASF